MPRTVHWLMAAGAVVTAAVLGEAWHGDPGEPAILGQQPRPPRPRRLADAIPAG